jgi:alpha-ketoglutarate-dependent taurine dioxygenase/DUF971 family protein
MSKYQPRYTEFKDGHIVVSWQDGHHSRFHQDWLRHQCECDHCGPSLTGIRNAWILDIPDDMGPPELSAGDEGVSVTWAWDHHQSFYSWEWLRDNCYSSESRSARYHHPVLWDRTIGKRMPVFDFVQVCNDQPTHLSLLECLRDLGFCKIVNIDTSLEGIEAIANLFGPVRQTHYGISEIREKPDQYNVGDSGRPLLPHQDETYRISAVGITILQVVAVSEQGGNSTLVDGFEVARRLRELDADAFDMLSTLPIRFQRLHTGHTPDGKHRWMVSRTPIFRLDETGAVVGTRINERHIAPVDLPADKIGPYYAALRKLFSITYDEDLRIEFPLDSGEGMVFDNQRLLHGRTAFDSTGSPRHIRTCSVDTEEFHSTLRLLQREMGTGEENRYLAQGM